MVDHIPQMYLMQATVAAQIENFAKFPPRQKPTSFNLDEVLAMMSAHGAHPEPGGFLPDSREQPGASDGRRARRSFA